MKLRNGDLLVIGLAVVLFCTTLIDRRCAEWLALGLIIMAGIPHGSFDLRAAEKTWGASPTRRLLLFIGYVMSGLCMSALCLQVPGIGLVAFLVISALHFSEGEALYATRLTAVCFGVGSILLPIGLHLPEASQYLNFFASQNTLEALSPYLHTAGMTMGVLLVITLLVDLSRGMRAELLQHSLCLLAWLMLPPLSGFCVWFIGRHSRQHLERCRSLLKVSAARAILWKRIPWDFVALSITAVALLTPLSLWFDLRDINQLFAASIILIAGLTLPHMILTHLCSPSEAPGKTDCSL
jgi:Brp/Blh family beta-carotene 15,15'-monooxygenase